MTQLTRRDPFRDLMSLREAMDDLFEESFVQPRQRRIEPRERRLRLPLDVYTTPEEIVIVASLPGLTPDEVDITIDGDRLTIRGELRPPLENVDYLFQERAYGPFARTLTLNVPINADEADAVFENGVLTLSLPKAEESKPRTIEVKRK
ncbi:MAG: Hsp20/alpha crystallin family protein [Chloroflexota bacterium]|nr:Hsp20/alpha crystallin family protein [Chloroflexota bacterium]